MTATIVSIIGFVTQYGPQIVQFISALVTAASVMNTMIPPGKPGSFNAGFKQVVNALSMGFGHAAPPAVTAPK